MTRTGLFTSTRVWAKALIIAAISSQPTIAAEPVVGFAPGDGSLEITIDNKPFASFVFQDPNISRPYFAHLKTAQGIQVTRNHPPIEGADSPDHATFHPGLWMSFGDINGSDYWRLAAPVRFQRFLKKPKGQAGRGSFTAQYDYMDQKDPDHVVCHEHFACDIRPGEGGVLILWDSTFSSDEEFTFGDQEEMGLGFRLATPIRAESDSEIGLAPGNGEIVNSEGGRNEKEIWGNTAKWCDYSGVADGQRVGIAIFTHPKNFRPSWFHSRDYGMLAANAFGRAAFGKGEKSEVTVKPGENLRLRYGVLVHASPAAQSFDPAQAYQQYVVLAGE